MDQKFDKWKEWFEDIGSEVRHLVRNKHIFWKFGSIVKNNPDIQKPNSFYTFVGDTYFAYCVISVRRQIKSNDRRSFARLLKEIIETPSVLSRKRFVAMYGKDAEYEANYDFSQFAQGNAEHIDPDIVKQDFAKLNELSSPIIERFTDKRIAHYDKWSMCAEDVPSFGELNACIDFLAELTKKYWLLFDSSAKDILLMPLNDCWEEIFRQPWIPSNTPNKPIDPDPLGMY